MIVGTCSGHKNRHMCASRVIQYEVSVSVHALEMSNGHVCTAGVMLHEAFGSLLTVDLRKDPYVQLVLC